MEEPLFDPPDVRHPEEKIMVLFLCCYLENIPQILLIYVYAGEVDDYKGFSHTSASIPLFSLCDGMVSRTICKFDSQKEKQ